MVWRRALQTRGEWTTQLHTLSASCMRSNIAFSKWSAFSCVSVKQLHSSSSTCGLEEFFPKTNNLIEEGEKTGMLFHCVKSLYCDADS